MSRINVKAKIKGFNNYTFDSFYLKKVNYLMRKEMDENHEFVCALCEVPVKLSSWMPGNIQTAHFRATSGHKEECKMYSEFIGYSGAARIESYKRGAYRSLMAVDVTRYKSDDPFLNKIFKDIIYAFHPDDIPDKDKEDHVWKDTGKEYTSFKFGKPFKDGVQFSLPKEELVIGTDQLMFLTFNKIDVKEGIGKYGPYKKRQVKTLDVIRFVDDKSTLDIAPTIDEEEITNE